MIRVEPQPEPLDFDKQVRQPGIADLAQNPGRAGLAPYWRRCLRQLWQAYGGICAYACLYIPPVVGGRTVEHFAAKSKRPELAYEWSNFRLVCSIMNSRKHHFDDVLDPFEVMNGWFVLELVTMEVAPRRELPRLLGDKVSETISRLGLNRTECCEARGQWLDEYRQGEITFAYLKKRCPFVALEMERQGLRVPDSCDHAWTFNDEAKPPR